MSLCHVYVKVKMGLLYFIYSKENVNIMPRLCHRVYNHACPHRDPLKGDLLYYSAWKKQAIMHVGAWTFSTGTTQPPYVLTCAWKGICIQIIRVFFPNSRLLVKATLLHKRYRFRNLRKQHLLPLRHLKPHVVERLLTQRQRIQDCLTLFCIHDLTDAHNRLVSVWSTGERGKTSCPPRAQRNCLSGCKFMISQWHRMHLDRCIIWNLLFFLV